MLHMSKLTSNAFKVTVFIYNHVALLSYLGKRSGWEEIVRPVVTQFTTPFITLKSLYDHKYDLQGLVTSKFYTSHSHQRMQLGKFLMLLL